MVDERQRWYDGDEIKKVGSHIRPTVPLKTAAGEELNHGNDA
jgi:hypothetical protein